MQDNRSEQIRRPSSVQRVLQVGISAAGRSSWLQLKLRGSYGAPFRWAPQSHTVSTSQAGGRCGSGRANRHPYRLAAHHIGIWRLVGEAGLARGRSALVHFRQPNADFPLR